jgi:DNA repair exonuclease SbcCD nuclease subunit
MSKILFTADWHIKLGQKNVPKEWQINRFHSFYAALEKYKDLVDFHIIGGDIFDRVPTLEEQELFLEYFTYNVPYSYIFDGNHEATKKGHTFFTNMKNHLERQGLCKFILESTSISNVDIIPYTELKTFNPSHFYNDILFTHVRGEIPPHVKPEINLDKLNRWNLVIAGDLHSHSNSQRNIVYPGSPMNVTFHRNRTQNGVIIIDTESGEWYWEALNLPQLVRKSVTNESEMIATHYDHTIYELTGNIQDLAKVAKLNPLLDKKVVKRVVDSTMNFKGLHTINDELLEYLTTVVQVQNTDRIIKTFNDNIQST